MAGCCLAAAAGGAPSGLARGCLPLSLRRALRPCAAAGWLPFCGGCLRGPRRCALRAPALRALRERPLDGRVAAAAPPGSRSWVVCCCGSPCGWWPPSST
eukprot:11236186-Alexandrium_andersonii.AAC.1